MTVANPPAMQTRTTVAAEPPVPSVTRDPRLDVFRGIAMFIILIAHIPNNPWTLWIPARFGFSDATEIFVFCSGMASAIAFGRVFERRGFWLGTARVAFRVWQVYWAHICLFLAIAGAMVALNASGLFERDYVRMLNLYPFINDPGPNLLGLLTLTYVPNYFDILPMYLVILAMMPLVAGAAMRSRLAAAAIVLALWAGAQVELLDLPAEPFSDRTWFFNPFGWQLVFFTGFALMAGWLPRPPVRPALIGLAGAVVILTVPLAHVKIARALPEIAAWRSANGILFEKSDFGVLRYLHFIALAYLAWAAAGTRGARLSALEATWLSPTLAAVRRVGQQSLAVFITSMVLARFLGVVLDLTGRTTWPTFIVNVVGALAIIATAYLVSWFKSQPWRDRSPTARNVA